MDVVLNWLWQGGVVALAVAAVLGAIPQSRTTARHAVVWSAYVLVLALPTVPYLVTVTSRGVPAHVTPASLGVLASMPAAWWTSTALAIGLWIAWASAYAVRFALAFGALRRTRRTCRECPASVEARLHHWSRVKGTCRPTRLVLSIDVRSAAVLGCGSPRIALAPALLEHLCDADLDRVVIHEWAHVQRRDDVAQLLQQFVRLVAGWHPAVWWLERQLEFEREVACDETAVALTGSAKNYATCLATLAALPLPPAGALPALAVVSSSGLRRRLTRILAAPRVAAARPWRAIAVTASAALAGLVLTVGQMHVVQSATSAPSHSPRELTTGMIPMHPAAPSALAERDVSAPASAAGTVRPAGRAKRAKRAFERSGSADVAESTADTTSTSADAVVRLESVDWPLAIPSPTLVATVLPNSAVYVSDRMPGSGGQARPPWVAAADAGVAVGRGARNASVATAGFFSRFGKKVAASF